MSVLHPPARNRYYLNTSYDDLTKRAQNIIDYLGGTARMVEYYVLHRTFLEIPLVGIHTENELCSFCHYLIDNENTLRADADYVTDTGFVASIYEAKRINVTPLLDFVLKNLEEKFQYHRSALHREVFVKELLINPHGYKNIDVHYSNRRRVFKQFRTDVWLTCQLRCNYRTDEETEQFLRAVKVKEMLGVVMELPVWLGFAVNAPGSFEKIVAVALFEAIGKHKKNLIILTNFYFNKEPFNAFFYSNKLKCSLEQIRQLLHKIKNETLPFIIRTVTDDLRVLPAPFAMDVNGHYFTAAVLKPFNFHGESYTANTVFSKHTLQALYEKDFFITDDILDNIRHLKNFGAGNDIIFISKSFCSNIRFKQLLEWLDCQAACCEPTVSELTLRELVIKFLNDHNLPYTPEVITSAVSVLVKIKNKVCMVEPQPAMPGDEKYSEICNDIHSFLGVLKQAQTTAAILHNLRPRHQLKNKELLYCLNLYNNRFKRFGHLRWGLAEWEKAGEMAGSIRQIAYELMLKKDEPVHISEIYDHLRLRRPINLAAIYSNLKHKSNAGKFRFFNCCYIGLYAKQYNEYWFKIPKATKGPLKKTLMQPNRLTGPEIESYAKKYGYPVSYIEFLIRKKHGEFYTGRKNKRV